ncbi:MAG: sulfur carrier protein ThiS [Planctomycetota bacterium]|jgi:thiamine biosynthesis protein ThiS
MDVIKINGQDREFEAGTFPITLTELLDHLDIKAATIVAEIDGEIIEREKFSESRLNNGQQIELIRFVGGG